MNHLKERDAHMKILLILPTLVSSLQNKKEDFNTRNAIENTVDNIAN